MRTTRGIYRWTLVAVLSACTLSGQVGCQSRLQRGGFSGLTPPNQALLAAPPESLAAPPRGIAGKVKEAAATTAAVAVFAVGSVLYVGLCLWVGDDDDDEDGFS